MVSSYWGNSRTEGKRKREQNSKRIAAEEES